MTSSSGWPVMPHRNKDLRRLGGLTQRLEGLDNLPRTKVRFARRCCVVGKQVPPVSRRTSEEGPIQEGLNFERTGFVARVGISSQHFYTYAFLGRG